LNPDLPHDAVEFGATARRAFESLGGVLAARRAEADPANRADVGDVLDVLGIADIDPRSDGDTAAAAAVLCAEAGRVALPYPVVGSLVRHDGMPTACVPTGRLRVDHGDLFGAWHVLAAYELGGTAHAKGEALGTRLGPFVTELVSDGELTTESTSATARPWWLTLTSWTILGGLERAVELACEHTSERIQFGKPLTAFQVVRFQLADASIAVAGLRELALFTTWRLHAAPEGAWPDVLALRSHALDVARSVLRTTQQLHGASGLCDEYDISILVRHLQPALRIPSGAEDVAVELAAAIADHGFDGLYPHGASMGATA
jgi:hypothetical protein